MIAVTKNLACPIQNMLCLGKEGILKMISFYILQEDSNCPFTPPQGIFLRAITNFSSASLLNWEPFLDYFVLENTCELYFFVGKQYTHILIMGHSYHEE